MFFFEKFIYCMNSKNFYGKTTLNRTLLRWLQECFSQHKKKSCWLGKLFVRKVCTIIWWDTLHISHLNSTFKKYLSAWWQWQQHSHPSIIPLCSCQFKILASYSLEKNPSLLEVIWFCVSDQGFSNSVLLALEIQC